VRQKEDGNPAHDRLLTGSGESFSDQSQASTGLRKGRTKMW
jgi:hypothetical protein